MLKEFQRLLKKQGIKYYIVPTNDDHLSEMIEPHFQTRAYLSGFNGSAGTLLVTPTNAYLWTDGRYFIQAAKQLNDGVELMKMGQKGVPTLFEFLSNHVKEHYRQGVLIKCPKEMRGKCLGAVAVLKHKINTDPKQKITLMVDINPY